MFNVQIVGGGPVVKNPRNTIMSIYIEGCALCTASTTRTLTATLRTLPTYPPSLLRSPTYIPLTLKSLVHNPLVFCSVRSDRVSVIGANSKKLNIRVKSSTAEMATEKGEEKLQVFDSEEDLAASLAKYTADLSDKFVKQRDAFTVVLSGGSLIKSLRKLVEPPYVDSVEWSKWHVFWVDERVVPKDHPESNYLLAYDGFLSKVPIPTGNVYAINDALSAEGAADDYETCVKHLVNRKIIATSTASGFPKFDLMLLGMGPDGHVASLFPGHSLVHENEKWVTFITDSPKPPAKRITFTFPVINSSAHIGLVVVGAGKAHPVNVALGNGRSSEVLPVQMVSPEGEMTWFLDKEAASKL